MMNTRTGLIALLASFAAGEVMAGTLSGYTVGDVLICFRKSGGGANDLVVDAGPLSTYTNAVANQRIPVSQFTPAQMAVLGVNNTSWSAFAWYDDTAAPNWTIFATRARTSLNSQTSPWAARSAGSQQLPILSTMSTIPPGAKDNLTFNGLNSSTAVIEEDSSSGNPNYPTGQSYHTALDPNNTGDNNFGDFVGNPENTTSAGFSASGSVVRSDFYQVPPIGSGSVKLLGYFEFAADGSMTYVAYPSAAPVIKTITRSGGVTTVTFTTGIYGTYTLRGINSLQAGTPVSSWPVISSVGGDGQMHTVMDPSLDDMKFYSVTAQ